MRYFLAYILILAGSLAFTAGSLGRFIYRGKLIFELDDLWRLILIVGSIAMLIGGIILYAYQAELDGMWSAIPVFATPTP